MMEFWMVWGEGTKRVTYKHHNEHDAAYEAERLAKQNPGQRFFVLRATEYRRSAGTEAVRLMKREELPF